VIYGHIGAKSSQGLFATGRNLMKLFFIILYVLFAKKISHAGMNEGPLAFDMQSKPLSSWKNIVTEM
jgi:hypothetical protein